MAKRKKRVSKKKAQRSHKASTKSAQKKSSRVFSWKNLSWNDLEDWTDSRSIQRGQRYQRRGAVRQLAICSDGGLVATVSGTHLYSTLIKIDNSQRLISKKIIGLCSCPVGHRCKHGVATILEYLDAIENKREVPEANSEDSRIAHAENGWQQGSTEDWDEDDFEDEPVFIQKNQARGKRKTTKKQVKRTRNKKNKKVSDSDIEAFLSGLSKKELVQRLLKICKTDRELKRSLADQIRLNSGDFAAVIAETKKELRSVTSEEAWYNGWKGAGHLPDYRRLKTLLGTLIEGQQYDAVVQLGGELVDLGLDQVGRSHDEGETAMQISSCFPLVAAALQKSSLAKPERLLFVINSLLKDDWDLLAPLAEVLDKKYSRRDWNSVAESLLKQLEGLSTPKTKQDSKEDFLGNAFHTDYNRQRLCDWVITALESAGDAEKATELCIAEARNSGAWQRAVDRLTGLKRFDEAWSLALEGLENTNPRYPGLVHRLQDSIGKLAAKRKNHWVELAIHADRFVQRPSATGFLDLLKLAKKAKLSKEVEMVARTFLETGISPEFKSGSGKTAPAKHSSKKSKKSSGGKHLSPRTLRWPFAAPPRPRELRQPTTRIDRARKKHSPHYEVLIRMNMDDGNPDGIINWYDQMLAASPKRSQFRHYRFDIEVAEAVSKKFPDRSVDIFCEQAEKITSQTNTKTYPEAIVLLKKSQKILQREKRSHEFEVIVKAFKQKHHRKRKFIELLGRIDGKPIVAKMGKR